MIKHGSSHGFAVLVCTVVSALLVDLLRQLFPALYEQMVVICSEIIGALDLSLEPGLLATLVIAVGLGVLWGFAFKYAFKK